MVGAATSVMEPEEDEFEVVKESPCIEGKIVRRKTPLVAFEFFGSFPVGEARSAIQLSKLLKRRVRRLGNGLAFGGVGRHVGCSCRL